jgi:hypothetical protein
MFRTISCLMLAALPLVPGRLMAGGPAWLCLPIDGVTSQNSGSCAALLTARLAGKRPSHAPWNRDVQIREHENQWYLTFYMGKNVALREVEAALAGSEFSVPRDRLRLFGHVVLEIDAGKQVPKQFLADLEALPFASVAESTAEQDRLLVTVDMPYPAAGSSPERDFAGWDKFHRSDLSSDPATKTEPPATADKLPGYDALRRLAARHGVGLKDIHWNPRYACRPLGGVAAASAQSAATPSGGRR